MGVSKRLDARHYVKLTALADKKSIVNMKLKTEEQAAVEAGHVEEMSRLLGWVVGECQSDGGGGR